MDSVLQLASIFMSTVRVVPLLSVATPATRMTTSHTGTWVLLSRGLQKSVSSTDLALGHHPACVSPFLLPEAIGDLQYSPRSFRIELVNLPMLVDARS